MIRRPIPKKPAQVHRVALTDDELHDLIINLEADERIRSARARRLIEAAFAER